MTHTELNNSRHILEEYNQVVALLSPDERKSQRERKYGNDASLLYVDWWDTLCNPDSELEEISDELESASSTWNTCVVGNMPILIPREGVYVSEPVDMGLKRKGKAFELAILHKRWTVARQLVVEMHLIATEILKDTINSK